MQSEQHCYDTVTSVCLAEHNPGVYQDIIHCHDSNSCSVSTDRPCCNDGGDHGNLSSIVSFISDVTDTNNSVNCYCVGAEARVVTLANSQAKYPNKLDADYLEIVAVDTDDSGDACGDSKPPSSCQANCRDDRRDDDYLQIVASEFRYHGTLYTQQ